MRVKWDILCFGSELEALKAPNLQKMIATAEFM